jgi:hypothetical protein
VAVGLIATYEGKPSAVDSKSMTVTGVIASPNVDQEGDIVEPGGLRMARHKTNPIVFLNHGFVAGVPGMSLPIGKCETPEGNYTCWYDPAADRAYATVYFAKNSPDAYVVFSLYAEDVLRGFSIGFMPIRIKGLLRQLVGRKRPGQHVVEADLVELSCVGVPANPDALRVKMDRGLGDISPELFKSLDAVAAKPKTWSASGFTLQRRLPSVIAKGASMPTAEENLECHAILFPADGFTAASAKEWLAKGNYTPEHDFPERDIVEVAPGATTGFSVKGWGYYRFPAAEVDVSSITTVPLADGVVGVYAAKAHMGLGDPAAVAGGQNTTGETEEEKTPMPGSVACNTLLKSIDDMLAVVEQPKLRKTLIRMARALTECHGECYPDQKCHTVKFLADEAEETRKSLDGIVVQGEFNTPAAPEPSPDDAQALANAMAALGALKAQLDGLRRNLYTATGKRA